MTIVTPHDCMNWLELSAYNIVDLMEETNTDKEYIEREVAKWNHVNA